jgi:hypothetical protein
MHHHRHLQPSLPHRQDVAADDLHEEMMCLNGVDLRLLVLRNQSLYLEEEALPALKLMLEVITPAPGSGILIISFTVVIGIQVVS